MLTSAALTLLSVCHLAMPHKKSKEKQTNQAKNASRSGAGFKHRYDKRQPAAQPKNRQNGDVDGRSVKDKSMLAEGDFAVRYCSSKHTNSGRNFWEFMLRPDGRLQVGSGKDVSVTLKEYHLSEAERNALKAVVLESEILKEHDTDWPAPDPRGCQELDITYSKDDWSYSTAIIDSLAEVHTSSDPVGLKAFYYLIQQLEGLVARMIDVKKMMVEL